ncbi:MAG: hypothetical protein ABJH98_06030 [Reichenbachiella sp.]|uniref:hypothetical protein n=1 Tax=Reichenbachiella sp. TaxID=2184521 RepID=UPI0032981AF5
MKHSETELDFKYAFFKVCLYVTVLATFYQLIVSLVVLTGAFHIMLSSTLFLVSVASLYFWKDPSKYSVIVWINAAVWTTAYIFYWIGTGGVFSAPAYVFFVLVIVFIIVLAKPYGYYYTVLFCATCLVLTVVAPTGMYEYHMTLSDDLYYVLATQFLICLLLIVISLHFLKTNFDKERSKNEESNETLISLTAELETKKKELLAKREKIENLKRNLEHLVHERTIQLEEKHEQLSQYAYDNAHTLRGALCNVLAIISLIKKEPNNSQTLDAIDRLNQKAIDLDSLVYQVNNLLK